MEVFMLGPEFRLFVSKSRWLSPVLFKYACFGNISAQFQAWNFDIFAVQQSRHQFHLCFTGHKCNTSQAMWMYHFSYNIVPCIHHNGNHRQNVMAANMYRKYRITNKFLPGVSYKILEQAEEVSQNIRKEQQ